MVRTFGRKLLWAYALLMLIAALGYARYDSYMMDGDGTAFLDIARYMNTGHAALAINGYWNPAYPAVLAFADRLAHPSLWRELVVVRYANVLIFAFAMAGCLFFTLGLTRGRTGATEHPDAFALPPAALHLLGLGLLMLSMGRELPLAAPRADTLLLAFLLFAAGLLLRLLAEPALWLFPALGLTLGLAYLTKSFAFLPSLAVIAGLFLYALLFKPAERTRLLTGTAILAAVFALAAGPYILAISRQVGHFTSGESARLNYAFFIDMTPRWHEWYLHDLGHAGGTFVHPEAVLAAPPPVFSYAAHPLGTFPLWFDPAWWTLGLKPHIWLKGHLFRLARNVVVFFRYLLGRPEPLILLGTLLFFGARLRRPRVTRAGLPHLLWALVPLLWGALMFAIYLPVDLQDRYLTGPFLLVLLPLFAALRTPSATPAQTHPQTSSPARADLASASSFSPTRATASALVLLFAGTGLLQAWTYLADRRRHTPPLEQRHPGFDHEIFPAAAALQQLGLHPGDAIACMSNIACYTDHYWARLAGAQILAQVDTPGEADPLQLWNSLPDKASLTAPLTRMGLKYLVTVFPNSTDKPAGWVQLGHSDFFAYPLQQPPLTPAQAQAIASFEPKP